MFKILIAVLLGILALCLSMPLLTEAPVLEQPVRIIKVAQVPTFPTLKPRIWNRAVGIEQGGRLIGSGVIIETGLVLSAAHVFSAGMANHDFSRFTVRLNVSSGGHVLSSQIKMVQFDEEKDLALVSCFTSPMPAIHLVPHEVPIGIPVVTVGAPMGIQHDLVSSLGFLSGKRDTSSSGFPHCWTISAPCFFGNSGGGAFEANGGYLVGIVSGGAGAPGAGMAPNVIFIVSADTIREFLKDRLKGK